MHSSEPLLCAAAVKSVVRTFPHEALVGDTVEFVADCKIGIKGTNETLTVPQFSEATVLKRNASHLFVQGVISPFTVKVHEDCIMIIGNNLTTAAPPAPPESMDGQPPAKKPKLKRKSYTDSEKRIFVGLLRSMRSQANRHVSIDDACDEAKLQFPGIFLTLRRFTANRWEDYIIELDKECKINISRQLSAATLAASKHKAEKENLDDLIPEIDKKKRRSKNKDPISAETKKAHWAKEFEHCSNRAVLPAEVLIGLAVMLWTMSQSGVPMTSAIALPLIIGHLLQSGHKSSVHSQQTYVPISSMKDEGIKPEPKTVFWTKRVVNAFCSRIGLSMRKGTKSFSKQRDDEQIKAIREIMYLRLLFMIVMFAIPQYLVYNFDETGVELLRFGNVGRAQRGMAEVTWHGFDDKRQFTACIVINALGEMILPTQVIWRGEPGLTGACPKPSQTDPAYLRHTQSKSHWTTLETLKELMLLLFEDFKKQCIKNGLDPLTQKWVLMMDCYPVHIHAEFLTWYKEEFHGNLIILFIPANFTGWLQPLDVWWNGPFKRIMKTLAAIWLSQKMAEQIQIGSTKTDWKPSMCKLNITLTALKAPFCSWLIDAFKQMAASIGLKGWEMCGLLRAFGKTRDDPDFKRAEEMNIAGTLFSSDSFTGKRNAKKAEGILGKHFASLLGDVADGFDQVDEEITEGAEGEASNDGIEDLVSAAATEPTRAFTFAELQQLEHDFDWECHETTLELLQKNGEAVAARNKKNLVASGWHARTRQQLTKTSHLG